MQDILRQRCFHHATREAAARCPSCGNYFCRECVTEHDDRVLCSTCLQETSLTGDKARKRFSGVWRFMVFTAAFVGIWMLFYYVGRMLLTLPSSFHEGTLWKELWWK